MKYFGENIMDISEIVGVFYDDNKHIKYFLYYDNDVLKTINIDDVPNNKQLILNLKIKERGISINNPIGIVRQI